MPASIFASSLAAGIRVASLDLCADEILLTLAPRPRIVSVTHLGASPAEFALAARAKGLPLNDGSIVSVARYKPDLLLASRPLSSGGARLARRLGIRVHVVSNAQGPAAVRQQVLEMGRLLDAPVAARSWVRRFDALAADRPPTRRALYLSHSGNSVGPLSSAWLAMAGIEPIELAPGRGRIEQIVRARPHTILHSEYRVSDWHRGGDWQRHPLIAGLEAERFKIDGRAFSCGGIAMLGAVEQLRRQRG